MKLFKCFLILAFALIVIIFSITSVNSQCTTMNDRFYIGAFNFLIRDHLHQPPIWNWYNELNYNAMHGYCGHFERDTLDYHDGGFYDARSVYESYIDQIISNWHTNQPYNSLILEREKVLRAAFGQRSTYQAELRDLNNTLCTLKTPGYGYDLHEIGQDENDTWYSSHFGETVKARHCFPNTTPDGDGAGTPGGGYIVRHLFENCEQVNYTAYDIDYSNSSGRRLMSDIKYPGYRWFVKPRMRIDSVYAKTHLYDPVVSVITKNFGGVTIDSTVIKCINFLKQISPTEYQYNGSYLERYYNMDKQDSSLSVVAMFLADPAQHNEKGYTLNLENSQVDYQVYWHGIVDVWLDYVRVDDEWAHYLFTDLDGNLPIQINPWRFGQRISDEVSAFANEPGFGYFYSDESGYNTLPCVAEVNRIVRTLSNNRTGLIEATNEGMLTHPDIAGLKNPPSGSDLLNYMYDIGAIKDVLMYTFYPYNIDRPLPANITVPNKKVYPSTVRFHCAPSNDLFNDTMNMQNADFLGINWLRRASTLAKNHNLLYSQTMQINADQLNLRNDPNGWGEREPLTEEISMQCYLGMAFGAKRIIQYSYHTEGTDSYPGLGMENTDFSKRIKNYYSYYNNDSNRIVYLNKWYGVASLNHDLRVVGDYMYPPGNTANHMTYDNTVTLNYTGGLSLPYRYLNNIASLYKNSPADNWIVPGNLSEDATNKRYWEIGFFDKPNENYSKYFMLVNKRCAPVTNGIGDERTVRLYFNSSQLSGFNNWVLTDIKTNNSIVFDKNNISNGVYFPYQFEPGEGKLFHLAPVMQEGGNFVGDEVFGGLTVNCKGNVNTNGHNLTINSGTTVEFNADCGITAENCSTVNINGNPSKTYLQGKNGAKWTGISTHNVSNSVYIGNVQFDNNKNGWVINSRNCYMNAIQNCNFNLTDVNSNENLGAIIINNENENYVISYIIGNTIYVKNTTAAIAVINNGEAVGSTHISSNIINSSGNGRIAVLIVNYNDGDMIENNISNFSEGVHTYCSNIYFSKNTLSSNKDGSEGLIGSSWSLLGMSGFQGYYNYGSNTIENMGNNCKNLNIDESVFLSYIGYNNFYVRYNTNSYNIYGISQINYYTVATYCCFNGNGNTAIYDLKDSLMNPLVLTEYPHILCNTKSDESVDFVYDNDLGFVDTVYKLNDSLIPIITNQQYIYLSYRKNLLLKNYDSVYTKGYELLSNYADSLYAPEIISGLFMAVNSYENNSEKMQGLKTFYEQLILNHSQNLLLVKSANYFIQKCKVALEQYQSALDGLEDIIQQNPYSYDGLLASWDYASVQLIMQNLPGGGGEINKEESEIANKNEISEFLIDSLRIKKLQKNDNYDKSAFTSNDRKELFKKTGNVLIDDRNRQKQKVSDLQNSIASVKNEPQKINKAKRELEQLQAINEVVKTKKPKNHNEYLNIVNNDIIKIVKDYGTNGQTNKTNTPTEYSLSQNYPNPFNPVTKINYDLPKDGKVKMVIYDILGREIKTLVNEFKKAGRYTIEFNGSSFASGIYFYRMQVQSQGSAVAEGNSFNAVKKMVLVK